MRKVLLLIGLIVISSSFSTTCMVYFTGIGCPHCARTDPIIFNQKLFKYNLTIIEYEIYMDRENAPIMSFYNQRYGFVFGIPQVIFGNGDSIAGDSPIINGIDQKLKEYPNSECLLLNGSIPFEKVDFNSLPGSPKIWYKNKVVIKGNQKINNSIVLNFLFKNQTPNGENLSYISVPYSGGKITFERGIKYKGWTFLWGRTEKSGELVSSSGQEINYKLTLPTVTSLALADSINPCALAVLAMVLVAITTYDPRNKRKILETGTAFTLTVFVMYFCYGLIIVKAFQLIQQLVTVKLFFYEALAIIGLLIGILELKDYFAYKPGTLLSEMPMSFRPKVKKLIEGITSPISAVFIGAFVTIFLLPCTMGPYVITGGILSSIEFIKAIPWLLYYNLLFVIPMIAITVGVYLGISKVEDVYGWRNRNIRKLHGIAGILLIGISIYLLLSSI